MYLERWKAHKVLGYRLFGSGSKYLLAGCRLFLGEGLFPEAAGTCPLKVLCLDFQDPV